MLVEKERFVRKQLKPASRKRRKYLFDELVKLDESYLDKPLYKYSLPELEVLHIAEKNKSKHVFAYVHGVSK